jgi:hypothetical protein
VVSHISLDDHGVSSDPLTRLATLATLSPKGARGLSRDSLLPSSLTKTQTRLSIDRDLPPRHGAQQ